MQKSESDLSRNKQDYRLFNIHNIVDCLSFDAVRAAHDDAGLDQAGAALMAKILASVSPAKAPHLVHTLGFTGSGKTSAIKAFAAENPGYLVLNFDTVMESLPNYQHDYSTLGAQAAFERWELPARTLGYAVLEAAINQRLNIAFDHSGARADHVALLGAIKPLGYRVTIIDTVCDADLALTRAQLRPGGRHFPPEYVYERKRTLDTLKPSYRSLADDWLEVTTNNPQAEPSGW